MYRKPIHIRTEIKWRASEINGKNISVLVDSNPIPATLEIEYENPMLEKGLLERIIGVRLQKRQGPIKLAVNTKAARPVSSVISDYYLTQDDWDILVKSNFAEPISPTEPTQ